MAALGLCHQGTGLFQQFGGSTLVKAQPCPVRCQIFPVKEAGAPHSLHTGQMHRMPAIIRQEGKLQLRDQDMVDLILRVHGAWTGNNVVAPRQGFGADQFQQQAGHRAVVIPEHDKLIRQCLCSALIKHFTLGGDGGKQAQLFAANAFRARHHPGAQPFDITAHLVEIGAAGFGAAAVQQKAACRCNISCSAAAQQGVAGKQRLDLIGALVQLFCIDGVVQTHHHFVRTGSIRLHHMGRSGIHDSPVLPGQDHAVQTVRVAGTVDALRQFAALFGSTGKPLHQGGFAAARPAFDQVHLHTGFVAQRFKIALETGRRCGTQKEINGIMSCSFHNRTPLFLF